MELYVQRNKMASLIRTKIILDNALTHSEMIQEVTDDFESSCKGKSGHEQNCTHVRHLDVIVHEVDVKNNNSLPSLSQLKSVVDVS